MQSGYYMLTTADKKTVEVLVPAKESGSSSRDEERDAEWRQLGDNSESVGHGKN